MIGSRCLKVILLLHCSVMAVAEEARFSWGAMKKEMRDRTVAQVRGREFGRLEPPSCRTVKPTKFYIYSSKALRRCIPDDRSQLEFLLDAAKRLHPEDQGRVGAGLFFSEQLQDHPWRTDDPAAASLFIVPSYLDIVSVSLCKPSSKYKRTSTGQPFATSRMKLSAALLAEEVAASPWYQRNEGRDHLMLIQHHSVRHLFHSPDMQLFTHTFRNFILGMKHGRQTVSHRIIYTLPLPNTCIVTIPHMAPSSLRRCQAEDVPHQQDGMGSRRGKLVCSPSSREERFEDYFTNRNYTLFFAGNTKRQARPALRKKAVGELGTVAGPNILVSTTELPRKGLEHCKLNEADVLQPAPCRVRSSIASEQFDHLMRASKFSLHIKGDDASSSRVFDAWDSGTLQIFLADRYFSDVAAFKCRVPWKGIISSIGEEAFARDPEGTTSRLLGGLEKDGLKRLRGMWELQQKHAADVLWHEPQSRVAHNVIEDAVRCLGDR